MGGFSYKEIYIEDGKRVLEVNILPEKHCNFDCIFCPIGRSYNKVDTQQSFDEMDDSLRELESMIENNKVSDAFNLTSMSYFYFAVYPQVFIHSAEYEL